MSLTSLMVYVDAHEAANERIELAGALADRFDAMLIGMSALALRPPVVVDGVPVDGVLMQAEIKNIKAKLAEKGNWFRAIAAGGRRRLEWRAALDLPTETLARECRSADIVVIGREAGRGDVYCALDPAGVILIVGRPALVVPPKVKSLSAERVVVGWKDTREARRAVYDALPLLRKAARVLVMESSRRARRAPLRSRSAMWCTISSDTRSVPTPGWSPWKMDQARNSSSGQRRMKAPTCSSPVHMDIAVSASGCSAV